LNQDSPAIRYELSISAEEAGRGTAKILTRGGKKLQVAIPAGIQEGEVVKLAGALMTTDNRAGDILIQVKIKPSPGGAQGEGSSGEVLQVSDGDFDSQVLGSDLPTVVDFWADWCSPCRMMAPVVERAAQTYAGKIKFCKLNVDENPQMASRYKAMSIPMFLVFKGGQVVDKIVGAVAENQFKSKLEAWR
jgi:thioredoxin 1